MKKEILSKEQQEILVGLIFWEMDIWKREQTVGHID
jgi:hypothetical protein